MTIAALILSFALATVVYFFVENPVRRSKDIGKLSVSALLLIGLILSVILGQFLRKTDGLPDRDIDLVKEVNFVRAVGEWEHFDHAPKIDYEGINISTPNNTVFPSIIFAGDSHVVQYYLRAKYLSNQTGHSVGFIGRTGCFILSQVGCSKESELITKLISDKRVKALVIGNIWGYRLKYNDFEPSVKSFKQTIMARPDLRVYVLLDYPWTPPNVNGQQGDYDPLLHFKRLNPNKDDFIVPYPSDNSWEKGNIAITKLLGDVATIIPVAPYICPNQECNLLKWYRDDDHLQPLQLEKEAIWLDQIFKLPKEN